MSIDAEINRAARGLSKTLIAIRRDIHQHPELGFQEQRTSRKIVEILKSVGLDRVQSGVAKTGVVGVLQGGRQTSRAVALRADMDALPITEANQVSYKSQTPGVMHACGHDGHVAVCLGAAMILKKIQARIPGAVKFIFQPAEELINRSGARAMIRAGALNDPDVEAIFGMHVSPKIHYGVIGASAGPIMAAADVFTITVHGKGGHGAQPENCTDPILIAHQIYSGIQGIERNLAGPDVRVISVCSLHAGTAFNVIPSTAEIMGTVRTYDVRVQAEIIRRMRAVVKGISGTHGGRCDLVYRKGHPAMCNDARLVEIVRAAGRALKVPVGANILTMGGEDFSLYTQKVPGAFMELGVQKDPAQPAYHHCRFDFDDRILSTGAAMLARCALLFLEQGSLER
ncbi:MAG: amidohydrolase [Verrucomicrobia bacterium]|nr:amidohydrolase [Verrucomicrobiota bacterium]MBU1734042.1 amidohydrolase [Verrucomicrobiota bacterium]MBU1857540.1 amidohydrolase [Verrucomicrobiota bacterium]